MNPQVAHPDFDDLPGWLTLIREARERIKDHVRRTPLVTSYTFSEEAERDVHMKLENLQRTGAFKLRGALNKVAQLDAESRKRGVIAASAGNHAQGLALAATLSEVKSLIVMPESTALIKVRRTEDYGAEVVLHGKTWDESHQHATALAEERGLYYVHPFDDPDIIAGQGTVGLEILEQLPDVRTVVSCVGGGGLCAGVALALKAQHPEIHMVGVQAQGADAMVQSFEADELLTVEHPNTIAEGIRVGRPGELTFELVRRHVDQMVSVSEQEIVDAVLQTLQKSKVVAETGGVVSAAALAAPGRVGGEDPVCAILSGGNIDLNFLGRLIQNGLAAQGFYFPLVVRINDQPGQLQTILGVISNHSANIVDIEHRRHGWQVPIGTVDVSILLEVRREGEGEGIAADLVAAGFEVR
ncbi:MAG: threonine ammonia-lyase [Planctomycetota bacterium]